MRLATFGRQLVSSTPRLIKQVSSARVLSVGSSKLLSSKPAQRRQFSTTVSAHASPAVTTADKMTVETPKEIFRKDYKPTEYKVPDLHLNFILGEDVTRVISSMTLTPNYEGSTPAPIKLNRGRAVDLQSIKINGAAVPASSYVLDDKFLTINGAPAGTFKLEIEVNIKPQENTSLDGLYKSSGNFTTQCEAEGFRNITFFYDRPDVMTKYTTRVEADKSKYPVLLSNGNLVDSGDLAGGRHFTVWEDPLPKPCYLFALVAGNLAMHEGSFTTKSGRKVALRFFASEADVDKTQFALESLIKAMKWDEEKFGYEYNLDLFNVVAVSDFNMGAMENKSLNIFNSRLVLASPTTATDTDYGRIEGVVGHEYFHDYTGNRITCRDWFQLTLKEGLTVYRDQEFSADMNSRPVKRIEDVIRLRTAQFAEDSGPMAHPVRPESYVKMDNFYTVTVYEKGSEVVRLYETVLGKDGFRKGMDLYFQRHQGQAVTCDDFLQCMADANHADLSGIKKWYAQAGTPLLTVTKKYDAAAKTFTLTLKQQTPATPGQDTKVPVLIPVRMGLLGADGKEIELVMGGKSHGKETVLKLDSEQATYVFENVASEPVPSLLRNFSAPVKMTVEGQTDADLMFLFAHDTDPFNRWEAGQILGRKLLLHLYNAAGDVSTGPELEKKLKAAGGVTPDLLKAFKTVLLDAKLDGAFVARAITLPAETEIVESLTHADPIRVHEVRSFVCKEVAAALKDDLWAVLSRVSDAPNTPFEFNAEASAKRALRGKVLGYLSFLADEDQKVVDECYKRFKAAGNMTDEISALGALIDCTKPERAKALNEFYEKWKNEPLVMLKWLSLQAFSNVPGNTENVKQLMSHPAFSITNPNSCYSLLLGYAGGSVKNFHALDGSGYEFMGDCVLQVDKINPQVASRMVQCFLRYKKFDEKRQQLMRAQLERISKAEKLSDNVFELVNKSL